MPDPLQGIRVLDFGRFIAGPFCAALLADLGAEVIRVEKVRGGEDRFLMPVTGDGDGAFYLQMNRGKRGMTLNPRTREGRSVLQRLVATTDVVVANLPDAALEALGLDYEALSAVKPDVILTSVSAFGAGGPSSHRLGFDGIGQAMSGVMYLSGRPGEPTKAYAPYVDFTTALAATVGTLAALMVRRDTGQGQHVRGSLLASALTVANGALMEQAMIRPDRVATGNRSQTQAPSDAFRTRDGWVLVQCIGQPLFERWTALVGEPHWLEDPRFADDRLRGDNGEVVSQRMAAWCGERTTAEALAALDAARIPAGPVLSPQQVLDDAHVQAIGFLRSVAVPGVGAAGSDGPWAGAGSDGRRAAAGSDGRRAAAGAPAPIAETPFSLSATPARVRGKAPALGEHTDTILTELGYSAEAVAALHERRVV